MLHACGTAAEVSLFFPGRFLVGGGANDSGGVAGPEDGLDPELQPDIPQTTSSADAQTQVCIKREMNRMGPRGEGGEERKRVRTKLKFTAVDDLPVRNSAEGVSHFSRDIFINKLH